MKFMNDVSFMFYGLGYVQSSLGQKERLREEEETMVSKRVLKESDESPLVLFCSLASKQS